MKRYETKTLQYALFIEELVLIMFFEFLRSNKHLFCDR